MTQATLRFTSWRVLAVAVGTCLLALIVQQSALAIEKIPEPKPVPGSYGLEARKPKAPPKQGANISNPSNGATTTEPTITISGVCPRGLLVEVLNNGVMAGSVMCDNGSFSIEISLFPGANEITVLVYDDLGQAGPKSNTITVTYNSTNFAEFGQQITLTSDFSRLSAPVGNQLTWPLQLSGGTGPYAFSIDWGDGSSNELKSQAAAGVVNISHVYKQAGVYNVSIRVTDANDVSAFLQVVAVANGEAQAPPASETDKSDNENVAASIPWGPAVATLLLIVPAFWLGRRSELVSLRNKMQKERDSYQGK